MQYIHVKNLEKYLPGYTDRVFAWLKIYFRDTIDTKNKTKHTGIFNDVGFQELDEIDRYRFIALACMEAACRKPVPLTDRNMLWMGWNLKKRSKSKTLQMLQRFIVSVTEKEVPVPQSRVDKEKSRVDESKYISIFDQARNEFYGTKRGLQTEYDNFQKKHEDWEKVLPLLLPAIKSQIINRERMRLKGDFVPPPKNFKTWINNRCWEETMPEKPKIPKPLCACGCGKEGHSSTGHQHFYSPECRVKVLGW